MNKIITTILALVGTIILCCMVVYGYPVYKNANEAMQYLNEQKANRDYISTLSGSIEANSMQWDNLQQQIETLKEQQEKLRETNIYLRATKEQEEGKIIENYKKEMGLI